MAMGHNPNTVTAANSILTLQIPGFFDTPIRIEGFQANNMHSYADAQMGETRMGVDGKQSIGYVAHDIAFTLSLEANSVSKDMLERFRAHCNANMETYLCNFVSTLTSTKKRTAFSGALVSCSGGTNAASLLEGSQYTFNVVINGEESI